MPTVLGPVPENKPPLATPEPSKPKPPLANPSRPETSLPPKAMLPLNSAPLAVDLTGRPLLRELRVVEPETVNEPPTPKVETGEELPTPTFPAGVTRKYDKPVVEATFKIGRVWLEEEAWTMREP